MKHPREIHRMDWNGTLLPTSWAGTWLISSGSGWAYTD
jgi:hypothetical protein